MKKFTAFALAAVMVAAAGCRAKHPSSIRIDPDFNPGEVGSILVLPVISTIREGDDPRRESERIPDRILREQTSQRYDYRFFSPEQFRTAVASAGLAEEYEQFRIDWGRNQTADMEFLQRVKADLDVDLMLIPVVFLWHKDEADYREAAAVSATQVGMTLSLVDPVTGKTMWEATDQNAQEAVRTEGDRVQSVSGGLDRRVSGTTTTGRDMYAAPPFEDVAILVIKVLVDAIPERSRATVR